MKGNSQFELQVRFVEIAHHTIYGIKMKWKTACTPTCVVLEGGRNAVVVVLVGGGQGLCD